mmetsp:Transcript_9357/g.15501  ORF Transcript_9357/g.15501 Transcript_9357/m.15501 type:complete len:336 (+) Transcript_9357:100-1107(+)
MSSDAKDESTEYNKKLKAYAFIAILSVINVASIAEASKVMPTNPTKDSGSIGTGINLLWGLFTLFVSVLIIVIDVVGIMKDKFDFGTAMDGKIEGYTLLLFNLVWTAGVITLTRAGGLGYAALNVYFSTWLAYFGCIYALDMWLGEKEYVTIKKLCSLSATLPYWWILWFASIVTFGSAADARRLLVGEEEQQQLLRDSCSLAIAIGLVSFCVSLFFILSHYEFLQCNMCTTWMTYGGIFELAVNLVVDIWQVVGIHFLTSAGKIGSSLTGQGDVGDADYVPGSNIYFATWASMVASISITAKWKQAKAMKFARAQNEEVNDEGGLDITDVDDEI